MRILTVHPGPAHSVADVHDGMVEGLRELGQQVAVFNLNDRLDFYDAVHIAPGRKALDREQAQALAINGLMSACYQFWPDVVLVISAFFVPTAMLDLLRSRGHRVVVYHTECPYEQARQLEVSAHADLTLLTDAIDIDTYRQHGPAYYLPHGYSPDTHHPGPPTPELGCDLTFVGTGFPSRVAFFEAMDLGGLDVMLAGPWMSLTAESPLNRWLIHERDASGYDNHRAVALYNSARCGINLYRRESQRPDLSAGWSVGPREIEMTACSLPFARDPRGEGDELFPMLPSFSDPREASEIVRWWVDNPDARGPAMEKARAAIEDRTFRHNAARLLRLLDA